MPTLDRWFDIDSGMYHYVALFLSKLSWNRGTVGVRLGLEPAANIDEHKQLAWAYCTARVPVKDMGEDSLAWPIDMLDFLLREQSKLSQVRAYKLDTDNNPITSITTYSPQILATDVIPIVHKHLSKVTRVYFIALQRGQGN